MRWALIPLLVVVLLAACGPSPAALLAPPTIAGGPSAEPGTAVDRRATAEPGTAVDRSATAEPFPEPTSTLDPERSAAWAELQEARERWALGTPARYTYLWRFVGDDRDWMYRMTMNGDVAEIERGQGTPMTEASFVAPRIDDTLMMLEQVILQGGTIGATYDDTLGYPISAALEPAGDAALPGTIAIEDFGILDGG